MNQSGFMLYYDDLEAIQQQLTPAQIGLLITALAYRGKYGKNPSINDPAVSMAFALLSQKIDRDAARYEEIAEKRRAAGRASAAARSNV